MTYSLLPLLVFFLTNAAPVLAASASVVTAGYKLPAPFAVAPGQVITFFVSGMAANLTGPVRAPGTPLPLELAGIRATLNQFDPAIPVPIVAVEPLSACGDNTQAGCSAYAAITVQLPFEMQADDPTVLRGAPVGAAQLVFSENGITSAKIDLISLVDQIHLLRTCDALYPNREITCRPVATHADGTLITGVNPARGGEEVVVYAFGLGAVPNAATGQAPASALPTSRAFAISFDARQNALASRPQIGSGSNANAIFVGLTSGYAGLYQINVVLPSLSADALACYPTSRVNGVQIESNLTINVAGPASFDGFGVCVEPLKK